jgi:hypothetical protein
MHMTRHDAEELIIIDLKLRFVFFGLQLVLEVPFSVSEMERVFSDARDNQASSKEYSFYESPGTKITGTVDAYESDSIHLRLRHKNATSILSRVIEAAHYEIIRINRANEVAGDD